MGLELKGVFKAVMLFREPVDLPDRKTIMGAMKKYTSAVRWKTGNKEKAMFSAWGNRLDAGPPAMMIVHSCKDFRGDSFNPLQLHMMMEIGEEDRDRILQECRYQVVAEEGVLNELSARLQANLAGNFLDALADLYPTCQAFYFPCTGKLIRPDELRTHQVKGLLRYLYFCVNLRCFKKEEEIVADTLGMHLLHLPDVQFYFHSFPANYVLECAQGTARVMLEQGKELPDGAALPSVRKDGEFDMNHRWKCNYEEALIGPRRRVLNVSMGEYALDPKGFC